MVRDQGLGGYFGNLVFRLANFSWLWGGGFGSNLVTKPSVASRSCGAGVLDLSRYGLLLGICTVK